MKNLRNIKYSARGFSIIELLAVMFIIGLLIGITVPAVTSFGGGTQLGTTARAIQGTLNVARSDGIAKHTAVRFGIVVECSKFPEYSYKRFGTWVWDRETREFVGESEFTELPQGLVFDPQLEDYVKDASYVEKDASAVQGTYFLSDPSAEFETTIGGGSARVRFVEFRPSGSVRIPGEYKRRFLLVVTEGEYEGNSIQYFGVGEGDTPKNWALFGIDHITGRSKIYRP